MQILVKILWKKTTKHKYSIALLIEKRLLSFRSSSELKFPSFSASSMLHWALETIEAFWNHSFWLLAIVVYTLYQMKNTSDEQFFFVIKRYEQEPSDLSYKDCIYETSILDICNWGYLSVSFRQIKWSTCSVRLRLMSVRVYALQPICYLGGSLILFRRKRLAPSEPSSLSANVFQDECIFSNVVTVCSQPFLLSSRYHLFRDSPMAALLCEAKERTCHVCSSLSVLKTLLQNYLIVVYFCCSLRLQAISSKMMGSEVIWFPRLAWISKARTVF